MATVFIDGQAGTTGLQITERLSTRDDLTVLFLSDHERKQAERRRDCLQAADIAVLCLPDDAARQAVELASGNTRILDASTAFRTHDNWVYGLPELCAESRRDIAQAQFVSNPGCYPQGFILLVRPLIEKGWLAADTPLRCNAVSGYSGGGRRLVETQQRYDETERDSLNTQAYALDLRHKHVPEMRHYSGTANLPLFAPMVANYYKGMLVQIPLFRQELAGHDPREVRELLADRYREEPFIDVLPYAVADATDNGYLNPTACNGTNLMQLMVFGNEEQLLLTARYDNLGKGAAGAAVQNLNLMLDLPESSGL